MTIRGADAVGTGITTANDHHMLASRPNLIDHVITGNELVVLGQELHCEMDAGQFATGNRQIARLFRATGQDHGIIFGQQRLGGNRFTNVLVDPELDSLGGHLRHATVDMLFLELEVGDAITQQSTNSIILLQQHHRVTSARQLLRGGHTGGAGTNHGNLLAGLAGGRLRLHPAHFPGLVDDRVFDRLDAHRVVVDVQRAGGFARRRTDAAGELGEVVGGMQHIDRLAPVLLEHKIIPIRNDVVDRAAAHAERNAAIHAARALHLGLIIGEVEDELFVVGQPLGHRQVGFRQALVFEESSDLAHYAASSTFCSAISINARLYSFGITLTNLPRYSFQLSSMVCAPTLPV